MKLPLISLLLLSLLFSNIFAMKRGGSYGINGGDFGPNFLLAYAVNREYERLTKTTNEVPVTKSTIETFIEKDFSKQEASAFVNHYSCEANKKISYKWKELYYEDAGYEERRQNKEVIRWFRYNNWEQELTQDRCPKTNEIGCCRWLAPQVKSYYNALEELKKENFIKASDYLSDALKPLSHSIRYDPNEKKYGAVKYADFLYFTPAMTALTTIAFWQKNNGEALRLLKKVIAHEWNYQYEPNTACYVASKEMLWWLAVIRREKEALSFIASDGSLKKYMEEISRKASVEVDNIPAGWAAKVLTESYKNDDFETIIRRVNHACLVNKSNAVFSYNINRKNWKFSTIFLFAQADLTPNYVNNLVLIPSSLSLYHYLKKDFCSDINESYPQFFNHWACYWYNNKKEKSLIEQKISEVSIWFNKNNWHGPCEFFKPCFYASQRGYCCFPYQVIAYKKSLYHLYEKKDFAKAKEFAAIACEPLERWLAIDYEKEEYKECNGNLYHPLALVLCSNLELLDKEYAKSFEYLKKMYESCAPSSLTKSAAAHTIAYEIWLRLAFYLRYKPAFDYVEQHPSLKEKLETLAAKQLGDNDLSENDLQSLLGDATSMDEVIMRVENYKKSKKDAQTSHSSANIKVSFSSVPAKKQSPRVSRVSSKKNKLSKQEKAKLASDKRKQAENKRRKK